MPSDGATFMTMHERIKLPTTAAQGPTSLLGFLNALSAKFNARMKRCADQYAAACAYEDLSRLSDTELSNRGLSRDVLARDLDR